MKKLRYYFLILNFLHRKSYPRREELIHYLKGHNIDISERTLYRALKEFETEFGLKIKLCNKQKGYYICEKNQTKAQFVLNCLKDLATADLLGEHSQNGLESFEDSRIGKSNIVPIENLQIVLEAIEQKRKIEFTYLSASKKILKQYTVSPAFVTQYQDLWYVVAKDREKAKTFDVELLQDITILETKYREDSNKLLENYNQSVGFGYCNAKPEEVELYFDADLKHKLIKKPIHHSQDLKVCSISGKVIASLNVRINDELKQEVLKYGNSVVVRKPSWLKNDIIKHLKDTLQSHIRV
ncbi:helix-turn-helix transcriptional regulator [Myroides sp. LJL116]